MFGYNKVYMEVDEWSTKDLPLPVKKENIICDSMNDNSEIFGQGGMEIRKEFLIYINQSYAFWIEMHMIK